MGAGRAPAALRTCGPQDLPSAGPLATAASVARARSVG